MEDEQQQDALDSQQEPQQDSELQTPQPDQPMPPEEQSAGSDEPQDESGSEEDTSAPSPSTQYRPRHLRPSERPSDQERYDAQQAELDGEREKHNERTGDGSLR